MTCCRSWISHLSNYIHDFLSCSQKSQQRELFSMCWDPSVWLISLGTDKWMFTDFISYNSSTFRLNQELENTFLYRLLKHFVFSFSHGHQLLVWPALHVITEMNVVEFEGSLVLQQTDWKQNKLTPLNPELTSQDQSQHSQPAAPESKWKMENKHYMLMNQTLKSVDWFSSVALIHCFCHVQLEEQQICKFFLLVENSSEI